MSRIRTLKGIKGSRDIRGCFGIVTTNIIEREFILLEQLEKIRKLKEKRAK